MVPVLVSLDAQRISLQSEDLSIHTSEGVNDAKVASARFEALIEVEHSERDLLAAVDATERKRSWDKLGELRSAVEFAQAACHKATALCGAPLPAGQLAAEPVEGEQPVAAELAAALPVVDASVDDHFDGADDDDALERMVAASHARAKGSRRGGGGGGGGKKSKGGKK